MNIPDEAVEAAANAISECSGMRFDGFWSRMEDLEPEDRDYALQEARAALEAALPSIAAIARADALREASLELMDVSEHESRMPGIRFAVGFLAGKSKP